jgi:hypothetical protein
MADAQVPWSVGALGGAVTDPAWRAKPSWYLVTTEDRMKPSGTFSRTDGRLTLPSQGLVTHMD